MQSADSNDIDQGVPKYAPAGDQGPIYFNPSMDK